MGRSNAAARKRNSQQLRPRGKAWPTAVSAPPPPRLDEIVLPVGRCGDHRLGKYQFRDQADAQRALAQAQSRRTSHGSGHVEKRVYQCPRCDYWHLSSRERWEER